MLLLIPYEVRTLFQRNPWGNLAIIAITALTFLLTVFEVLPDELVLNMVLGAGSSFALLGHQFLHVGWVHLIGNLVFLFVFGNAICGIMNTYLYTAAYLILGISAGAVHMFFDGAPAVGASGALCGVMGLYLAVYPLNQINCAWWVLIRFGTFGLPGWLLIVFWFIADLFGAFTASGGVAHWAHVGGMVTGFCLGLLLIQVRLVDIYDYDHPTVLGLIRGERAPRHDL